MAVHNVKAKNDVIPSTGPAATEGPGKSEKTAKASNAAAAYGKAGSPPTVSDAANVQISPRAKEMSMARKIAEETPDVDEGKVNKYKNLIAKGEYKPDAAKIADGMAREALMHEFAHNQD